MATPQELLGQLRTRGFETGFQRTPLREFKGKLDSITSEMAETTSGPRQRILYNYSEVDVIETTEPYVAPIAQISIMNSTREDSFMGVFGTSVDNIINVDKDGKPLPDGSLELKGQDYLVGKTNHLKITGGHMMWDRDKGERTPRECWEVVGVEGVETPISTATAPTGKKVSSTNEALKLLDGKTEQEWYTKVFQDPAVKADANLVNSIIQRTFLQPLIDGGIVTVDDNGIHHCNLPG